MKLDRLGHCCSTPCCQRDLDEKVAAVEDMEKKYSIPKGQLWGDRKNLEPTEMSNKQMSYAVRRAKVKIEGAAKLHFGRCLQRHETDPVFNNLDRLRANQIPIQPTRLQVPSRPEIPPRERVEYEAALFKWGNYNTTKEDARIFKEWENQSQSTAGQKSGSVEQVVLTPGSQQFVENLFEQAYGRLIQGERDFAQTRKQLLQLRDFLQVWQPIRGPNILFHALQFVLSERAFTRLGHQMFMMQDRLAQGFRASVITREQYEQMEEWRMEVERSLDGHRRTINEWWEAHPESRGLVARFQTDPANVAYCRAQMMRFEEQAQRNQQRPQ